MAKKKSKMEIISYTYKLNGETHTATAAPQNPAPKKRSALTRGMVADESNGGCNCGETKCVNGQKLKCMPLDDEGTCIWFITSETC